VFWRPSLCLSRRTSSSSVSNCLEKKKFLPKHYKNESKETKVHKTRMPKNDRGDNGCFKKKNYRKPLFWTKLQN
jgi:hypothetical protein